MKFIADKYTMRARIFPAVIGVIPFALVANFVPIEPVLLKTIVGVFSASLVYFATQFVIRIPAKMFEEWLFSDGLNMPTTNLLLYKNSEYLDEFKDNLRVQIKRDFNINLSSKSEELTDEIMARRRIKDATRLMIGKVKGGHLLLKHNYEYGFSRNLWSSSILGIIGSGILLALSAFKHNESFIWISICLLIFYISYVVFGHFLIKYTGKLYARKLIEEYYGN